jgi:RND family efflux transporter MFP subunit
MASLLGIVPAHSIIANWTCGRPRILKEKPVYAHPTPRPSLAGLSLIAVVALAACSKPAPQAEEIRPVRALELEAKPVGDYAEFPGEVRARYESRLGFRVGGKIVARKVDVGAIVKRGQLLMQLDPQDLKLAEAQTLAALRAAETNRDLAQADFKRHQELRARNFVSQAVLDAKEGALKAAQSNVDAARAAYRGQANQAGYASLESDADGVVTAVEAEVGQVVAAGASVVRVARTDEKEVVIGVPEDKVGALRRMEQVTVHLWANPGAAIAGKIREIAPVADPATRTYTVKVAIPARADVRLGMSATVRLFAGGAATAVRVPLTALVQNKGTTSVWVVEQGKVRLVPVQVAGPAGNELVLAGGVTPGQTVVTAGVNLLKDGQKVRILTADVARRADAEVAASGGVAK